MKRNPSDWKVNIITGTATADNVTVLWDAETQRYYYVHRDKPLIAIPQCSDIFGAIALFEKLES